MSFGVSPEQSRPYDVRTTQPFTCIYSKEINENIGCSQILFIYIHALTDKCRFGLGAATKLTTQLAFSPLQYASTEVDVDSSSAQPRRNASVLVRS